MAQVVHVMIYCQRYDYSGLLIWNAREISEQIARTVLYMTKVLEWIKSHCQQLSGMHTFLQFPKFSSHENNQDVNRANSKS